MRENGRLTARETVIMNSAFMTGRIYATGGEKETPFEIGEKLVEGCLNALHIADQAGDLAENCKRCGRHPGQHNCGIPCPCEPDADNCPRLHDNTVHKAICVKIAEAIGLDERAVGPALVISIRAMIDLYCGAPLRTEEGRIIDLLGDNVAMSNEHFQAICREAKKLEAQNKDLRNKLNAYNEAGIGVELKRQGLEAVVAEGERICEHMYESDCHGIEMIKSPTGKEWAVGGTNDPDRWTHDPWCGGELVEKKAETPFDPTGAGYKVETDYQKAASLMFETLKEGKVRWGELARSVEVSARTKEILKVLASRGGCSYREIESAFRALGSFDEVALCMDLASQANRDLTDYVGNVTYQKTKECTDEDFREQLIDAKEHIANIQRDLRSARAESKHWEKRSLAHIKTITRLAAGREAPKTTKKAEECTGQPDCKCGSCLYEARKDIGRMEEGQRLSKVIAKHQADFAEERKVRHAQLVEKEKKAEEYWDLYRNADRVSQRLRIKLEATEAVVEGLPEALEDGMALTLMKTAHGFMAHIQLRNTPYKENAWKTEDTISAAVGAALTGHGKGRGKG